MKRYLLLFFYLTVFTSTANAQFVYGEGLVHTVVIRFSSDTIHNYLPDTASTPIWQIGSTHKNFFTVDTNASAIMTDTLNHYPINANNWFVIKVPHFIWGESPLISFWHKYQTTSGKDGGVVEYSRNLGLTWDNVTDSCNIDSGSISGWAYTGIFTSNFYRPQDTLQSGQPSFGGVCDTMRLSRFQFADPPGEKSTLGSGCTWWDVDTFYIRFRFISDTAADTFAGWFIDSIKVDYYNMGGSVERIDKTPSLKVFPHPSYTGTFTFPPLKNEQQFTTEIYNTLGQRILQAPYKHLLNISQFPKGLYFYRVTDGTEYYSGGLLYE